MRCAIAGASLICVLLAGCDDGPAAKPAATAPSPASALIDTSDPQVAAFMGGATVGQPVASITLAQSPQEVRYLHDVRCFDDPCFTAEKFEKFILQTYPDIKTVPIRLPVDLRDEDSETKAFYRQQVRMALYFAKRIKLADGQTLFDLMTRCSGRYSDATRADVSFPPGSDDAYLSLQYFLYFTFKPTGEEFELDVLLDRKGDQLVAISPAFSSHVLNAPDFMQHHGVTCRRSGAQAQ